MTTFVIPPADHLRVSVIIVSHGTSIWLQRCLQTLVTNTPRWYEVVIVDNASTDDTRRVLDDHVSGARVVLNDGNVGFGPANNQGALLARAPSLCLLNPDALVQPGWLEPMLDRLESDATVGAVVPMLLNWDETAWERGFRGSLQEAGCIVGNDGVTQSLGYGDDPHWPWYRFPRAIDYGSAACMAVRRSAFEAVGGFDPVYAPAYCEDVDLCLAMDGQGWKTVYEPRSTAIHVRGAAGSDAGRARLLEEHTAVLAERWTERLARRPSITELPAFAHRSVAARDARCRGRVLVAGAGAAAQEAALLAERLPDVRITLVADVSLPETEALLSAGVEVVAGPHYDWPDFFERRWFQYDAVVDHGPGGELAGQIRRTQPQAQPVTLDGLVGAGIVA